MIAILCATAVPGRGEHVAGPLQHVLTDAAWEPLAFDEQRVRSTDERSPADRVHWLA